MILGPPTVMGLLLPPILFVAFCGGAIAVFIEETKNERMKNILRWIYGVVIIVALTYSLWHLLWIVPCVLVYSVIYADINNPVTPTNSGNRHYRRR